VAFHGARPNTHTLSGVWNGSASGNERGESIQLAWRCWSRLCSNDPICAQHEPGESIERRWLHGAACHGCTFVAETSCEMHNDYLDRALVVPVIGVPGAAFFGGVS
jgi:hypothetical protein